MANLHLKRNAVIDTLNMIARALEFLATHPSARERTAIFRIGKIVKSYIAPAEIRLLGNICAALAAV